MPDNLLIYLLLVAALAIGYLLGRRERRRRALPPGEPYLASLHQLVNEQRDLDVDQLIAAIVAQDQGVETRLALGALIRRRGEVDKAIRVHQGLLARPGLSETERARTELELARDYMVAGLLGRAENLLVELARHPGEPRLAAQRALLEIYQREREWQQAVEVGCEIARHDRSVRGTLAHFQCELAEAALGHGDLRQAREALARGSDFDPACARVSLLGAAVEIEAGRHRDACRLLRKAVAQDADAVPLAIGPYRIACQALGDDAGRVAFLRACLECGPYLPAVSELADHIEAHQGTAAAAEFVLEQLLRNPTLGGFVALLEHLDRDAQPLAPERLALVRRFSKSLLNRQPSYRCGHCGFSSRSLMWQCPSCHEWGSCKPITGAEQPAH